MEIKSDLQIEFDAWLDERNITDPHERHGLLEEFLATRPAQLKADAEKFVELHRDEYIPSDFNRERLLYYLSLEDLPPTLQNLEMAFAHYKKTGGLALRQPDPEPAVKPQDVPERRSGAWRNGRFIPDWNNPTTETVYAQHVPTPQTVGQVAPGGEGAVIRKNHCNMSADEYLKAINTSRAFQKKMDETE